MPNTYFQFKQFRIEQALSGMKVTTDACLFGGWVASEIQKFKKEPVRILDIGTGTGLLSLMLAQVTERSQIDGVEINEQAFKEATQNFAHSKWRERFHCKHTSIQNFQADQKYDLIICNPPFFKDSKQGADSNKNQALHSITLPTEELLSNVLRLLSPSGKFYLLFPKREMEDFIKLVQLKGLSLQHEAFIRNQEGSGIFRIIASFSLKNKTIPKISEIIIRDTDRQYTNDSWGLLAPYYQKYNAPSAKWT